MNNWLTKTIMLHQNSQNVQIIEKIKMLEIKIASSWL